MMKGGTCLCRRRHLRPNPKWVLRRWRRRASGPKGGRGCTHLCSGLRGVRGPGCGLLLRLQVRGIVACVQGSLLREVRRQVGARSAGL